MLPLVALRVLGTSGRSLGGYLIVLSGGVALSGGVIVLWVVPGVRAASVRSIPSGTGRTRLVTGDLRKRAIRLVSNHVKVMVPTILTPLIPRAPVTALTPFWRWF